MMARERSLEEIAYVLYGGKRPAQPAPEKHQEAGPTTPDPRTAPAPRTSDVVRDLIGQDDRLLDLLEQDIADLEAAELEDEAAVQRNLGRED